jgi:pimeloyl-ACP methyl ester carboxylesterase
MVFRILAYSGGGIFLLLSVALAYRAFRQHTVAKSLAIHSPSGIAQGMFVRIGGIDQWIQIRGEDRENPVLLVLHGGPAYSYLSMTPFFRSWEKDFTVVQWDRRGVGKTFGRNGKSPGDQTGFDGLAQDGIEVTEWLLQHLHKQKIILLGHSMGSIVGVVMARQRPDLFYAYVGTDQIIDGPRNEAVSYEKLMIRVRQAANRKAIQELEELGPPPYKTLKQWWAKQQWITATDPIAPNFERRLLPLALFAPNYSLKDIRDVGAGMQYTTAGLLPEIMSYDIRQKGTAFETPVFMFEGEQDVLDPTELTVEYFGLIEAPHKELLLLEGAGHNAIITGPDQFLKELVARVRPLATRQAPEKAAE